MEFIIQDSEDAYRVVNAAKIAIEMGIHFRYEYRPGPSSNEGTDCIVLESQHDLDMLKNEIEKDDRDK